MYNFIRACNFYAVTLLIASVQGRWRVKDHAILEAFGPSIWLCDGPVVVGAMGFHFPTRMVAIRLKSEELFIWSPVALCEDLRNELSSIGRIGHVVAPNTLHHVFLESWRQAYPDATYHAAPGLRTKQRELRIDEDLGPEPPKPGLARSIRSCSRATR